MVEDAVEVFESPRVVLSWETLLVVFCRHRLHPPGGSSPLARTPGTCLRSFPFARPRLLRAYVRWEPPKPCTV